MKNNIIAIDVSKEYILHLDKVLERSKLEILEWFEIPNQDFRVKAFICKDISSLIEGLKRRGFGPYPDYMVACMIDEDPTTFTERSLNFYEPPTKSTTKEYTKKEYNQVIFHELIHYITDMIFGKLPEWLTEGIAKYLDGSYNEDITNLMTNYINTYQIPDISTMKGDKFILTTEDNSLKKSNSPSSTRTIYNGYDLSYIMVRYIIEVYGKDHLFSLMKNKDQLALIENQILKEAIEYFNSHYLKENTIKK